MDYIIIETFLAIAETRSLSKAAEKLFTSQSTISYRLKVLEKEIGTELIEREQGKGFITITAKGKEFIGIAQGMQSILKNIEVWKLKKPLNELSIGCVDSINTCIFNELYKIIFNNDTNLLLNISSHWSITIHELIENYEIDVGFTSYPIQSNNVVIKPLFTEKMVFISSIESNFPDKVYPMDLDAKKEIYFYCGTNFQLWHDNWFVTNEQHKYSTIDTASLLSTFIDIPNYWSIVPISVAKNLSKIKSIKISEILSPPPDRVCYQVTNKAPIPSKIKTMQIFDKYLEDFLNSDIFKSMISF